MKTKAFSMQFGFVALMLGFSAWSSWYLRSIDTTPAAYLSGLMSGMMGYSHDSLIRVNLYTGTIALYEDGKFLKQSRISASGNPLDSTATPTGTFRILSKERSHTSRLSGVIMPYSMRFFEGYYFHAIPLTPGGVLINTKYSHGCIRLPDGLIEEVFSWARVGTRVELFSASLATDGIAPTVYLLTQDGHRQPFTTERAFVNRGYRWRDVAIVPADELAAMPYGGAIQ